MGAMMAVLLLAVPATAKEFLFKTNMGDFTVVTYESTPTAAANFMQYVISDRFDNVVITYSATTPLVSGGSGDIVWAGSVAADDAYVSDTNPYGWYQTEPFDSVKNLDEAGEPSVRGTITMAQTGDGSYSNGFFFNITDNLTLADPDDPTVAAFTTFGEVTEGMDVLDAIFSLPVEQVYDGFPNMPYNDLDASGGSSIGEQVLIEDVQVVPEPSTLGLLAVAGIALLGMRRRRRLAVVHKGHRATRPSARPSW